MSTPPSNEQPYQQPQWGQPGYTPAPQWGQPGYPAPQTTTNQRGAAARTVSATHAWIWAGVTLGYMLPWAISATRGSRLSAPVFWINLLTGWTVIGWFVALVMAFWPHQYVPPAQVVYVNTPPVQQPYQPYQPAPVASPGYPQLPEDTRLPEDTERYPSAEETARDDSTTGGNQKA